MGGWGRGDGLGDDGREERGVGGEERMGGVKSGEGSEVAHVKICSFAELALIIFLCFADMLSSV